MNKNRISLNMFVPSLAVPLSCLHYAFTFYERHCYWIFSSVSTRKNILVCAHGTVTVFFFSFFRRPNYQIDWKNCRTCCEMCAGGHQDTETRQGRKKRKKRICYWVHCWSLNYTHKTHTVFFCLVVDSEKGFFYWTLIITFCHYWRSAPLSAQNNR